MDQVTDSTASAVVDKSLHYRRITDRTPRGQTMLVIRKDAGVGKVGKLGVKEDFYTHWFPMPTFADEDAEQ